LRPRQRNKHVQHAPRQYTASLRGASSLPASDPRDSRAGATNGASATTRPRLFSFPLKIARSRPCVYTPNRGIGRTGQGELVGYADNVVVPAKGVQSFLSPYPARVVAFVQERVRPALGESRPLTAAETGGRDNSAANCSVCASLLAQATAAAFMMAPSVRWDNDSIFERRFRPR